VALADYRLCDVCGCKAFYDATLEYQRYEDGEFRPSHNCGVWAVLCVACAKTHTVSVVAVSPPSGVEGGADAPPEEGKV